MASSPPVLRDVNLDDKYELESGRVYLTGAQAFVRLLMLQRQRDKLAGLNTGGFVSGYRGSPLGALDQSLWKAQKFLDRANIKFQPGLNEDLAATSIWGSQQVNLHPGAKVDGVFAMWYGKGPGVDRCGDVFKHANFAGTSKHGGVLVLAGDDHAAKSSTLPHQSDHQFSAAMIPVLYPSSVQEILDLGLHGWAMSRYSGCWVGFKCVADTVESSSSVYIDPSRTKIIVPDDFPLPPEGVSIRWPDGFLDTEARMQDYKIYAALHYCRVNQLNRIVIDSPKPRLGIATSGKSYPDVRQALDDLGITERDAAEMGVRVYKIAMPWPLEPEGVRQLRRGARGNPRGRGKAADRRVPVEGAALQLARRRSSAGGRQVRRKGRMGAPARRLAAARRRRTDAGDDRARHCATDRAPRTASADDGEDPRPCGLDQRQGKSARQAQDRPGPAALLLLRLPAQHVDEAARRQPRDRRHRLPRDGDLDGPQHVRIHAHGRRRRAVDRPGAVHRREAYLREPRRRHLLPQRDIGDSRRGRRRRQYHVQDPLQRRGGDDRRPADRRAAVAGRRREAGCGGRRQADHRRQRRARQISVRLFLRATSAFTIATSSMPCSASCAKFRASRSCSTIRPARRRSAGGASAASFRTRPSASSSTSWCAKAAAIAACNRTACRSRRWRRSSAASARSTSRRATRTIRA